MSGYTYSIDPNNENIIVGTNDTSIKGVYRTNGRVITIVFNTDYGLITALYSLQKILMRMSDRSTVPREEKDGYRRYELKKLSNKSKKLGITKNVSYLLFKQTKDSVELRIHGPFMMAVCASILRHWFKECVGFSDGVGLEQVDMTGCLYRIAYPREFRERMPLWFGKLSSFNDASIDRIAGHREPIGSVLRIHALRQVLGVPEEHYVPFVGAVVGDIACHSSTNYDSVDSLNALMLQNAMFERMRYNAFIQKVACSCLSGSNYPFAAADSIDPIVVSPSDYALIKDAFVGYFPTPEGAVPLGVLRYKDHSDVYHATWDSTDEHVGLDLTTAMLDIPGLNPGMYVKLVYERSVRLSVSLPNSKEKVTYTHHYSGRPVEMKRPDDDEDEQEHDD